MSKANIAEILLPVHSYLAKFTGLDLATLQEDVAVWQRETFADQTAEAKINHLLREVKELLEHPQDLMEMADILILTLGIAALANITAETLVEAARDKFTLRQSCQWERLADGSYHHTSEDASLRRAFDHKWSLPRPSLSDQMNAALGQEWQPQILAETAFPTAASSMAPSADPTTSAAESPERFSPVSEPSQPELSHTL